MEIFLNFKIELCEKSNLYSDAEFYRNVLKEFLKLDILSFKQLLDFNILNSNSYFLESLLELKNIINS
jgi:hypothetical protein